ncbi:MAG TPA: alpha/beta family hydrolase [Thermoanaerobaculia bacterium]|nr:alpha/beta family hydrolase [Thermoanaerobaculia bacterium]
MHTEDLRFSVGSETLAATRILASSGEPPSIVSFHGTGTTAHRGRIRYVLDFLAERGVSSACFDFSGHGESSGPFEAANLGVRIREAFQAATLLCPPSPRGIIGTSMGARLAAVLSPQLHPRTLILFCPAAYSCDQAESPAFAGLRQFEGKLLIIAGRKDEVSGAETVERYAASAPAADSKVIWLEQCGHAIHPWLGEHETERAAVLEEIVAAIS